MRSSAAERLRGAPADEEGQILPLLCAFLIALILFSFVLFHVGAASRLATEGQTAADAAALAGAQDVKRQAEALTVAGGGGFTAAAINPIPVCLAAADYARRNDGTLTSCRLEQFDVLTTVRSRTLRKPDAADPVEVRRNAARATSRARARVEGLYSAIPAGLGGGGGSAGGSGGGGGAAPGGGSGVSTTELRDLEEKAGVKALPDTSLRTYGSKVTGLTDYMKIAILKAEALLKRPLQINSGFRSVAEQAAICASGTALGGRCAPPGQSYHNKGLAIDVANSADLARVASRVGLCQPFPNDDYVHFSPIGGSECGGSAAPAAGGGGGGGGGAFGGPGGLASFVTFKVLLVPLDDGIGGL